MAAPVFTAAEAKKVETFLRSKLNPKLAVRLRQRADECAEIYIDSELLGVVSKNVEEGEVSYSFEIVILESREHLPQKGAREGRQVPARNACARTF